MKDWFRKQYRIVERNYSHLVIPRFVVQEREFGVFWWNDWVDSFLLNMDPDGYEELSEAESTLLKHLEEERSEDKVIKNYK